MDLLVLRYYEAIQHVPRVKTYAIRIYSKLPGTAGFVRKPLIENPNWAHVAEYVFDDILPREAITYKGDTLFDESIAEKILTDFHAHKDELEALLVSCRGGASRSPAVGIALNEIFGLGHDTKVLKGKHPRLNRYIYETMIKTATRLIL